MPSWLRCQFLSILVISLPDDTRIQQIFTAFFEQEWPEDLVLVEIWLAASIATTYLPIQVRYVLIISLVLFIPGYCILSALFPKIDDIGFAERIEFSFGISIALVFLIGLGMNFTSGGFLLDAFELLLLVVAVIMVPVAFYRRASLPSKLRFRMPFSRIGDTIHERLFPPGSARVNRLLSIILVLVIFVAMTTIVYVIASPKESEHFSEFFLLGENRMADDYPNQITAGLNYPMFVGVGNHEYRNMTYTIEMWNMLTKFDTVTNTTAIIGMDRNDQLMLSLTQNETILIPYNLSVRKIGYNRVGFLLFNETVPGPDVIGSDRINASYRDLYLLITVR